jgi:hypothetical protein
VTTIPTVFCTGESRFNRRKMRSNEVTFCVEFGAFAMIHEIMSAIKNHPGRVVKVRREFGG